ncbi:dehypoxanthine futalosine cyclase [bacterium]|nr:dehypoxanthine futalosine cyclase [bacterium]
MSSITANNQAQHLRIVNVNFLNGAPFRGLAQVPEVVYSEALPAECARKLFEGEADLALIPTAEFLKDGRLKILPFGIACRGKVESVLLLSEQPFENLDRVILDSRSRTSVLLFKALLQRIGRDHLELSYADPQTIFLEKDSRDGILVIGDEALKLANHYSYKLDLGELWFEATGLPFVFAVWAFAPSCQPGVEREEQLLAALNTSLDHAHIYATEWVERAGKQAPLTRQEALSYVTEVIRYRIGSDEMQGLEHFLQAAQAQNLVSQGMQVNGISQLNTAEILDRAASGKRIAMHEALHLVEHAALSDLGIAADLRNRFTEDRSTTGAISYIVDRNINYTNVCNVYCRFCAFYRAPGKAGGYVLTHQEILSKIAEILPHGGNQILLQGGLHPELGIEYYEQLFKVIKREFPQVNLHALSADEVWHIAKVSNLDLDQVMQRLIQAGLGSFPGGGAEILVDRVRRRIARLKTTSHEWIEAHRAAHRHGLVSTCTMMFGVQETWEDRILHLQRLRDLQDETNGFSAFICWTFQDENTKLKRGDTTALEYLKTQAVARLFLDNIPHLQSSWVTQGPSIGQIALFFGADDFGSVMFEENVVSAAGTTFCMTSDLIEAHIKEAGFMPWRRDIHYQVVNN